MMSPGRILTGALAWMVLLAGDAAVGQIDYRVNRGNARGTGHALDRNTGFGTRGTNLPGSAFDLGLRANAIVSGNVTGLDRFHGKTQVLTGSQFRTTLPTAGLSGFHSRSIGASGLRPNQVPAPAYYFGAQETVADLGLIRQGLNAPGSSKLRSAHSAPIRPSAMKPLPEFSRLGSSLDLRLGDGPTTPRLGVFERAAAPADHQDPLGTSGARYRSLGESLIFGTPSPAPSARTDQLRRRWLDGTGLRAPIQRAGSAGELLEAADRRWKPLAAEGPGGLPAIRPGSALVLDGPGVPRSTLGTRQTSDRGTALDEGAPSVGQRPADLGHDRFADLYRAVRVAQRLGVHQLGFQVVEPADQRGRSGVGDAAGATTALPVDRPAIRRRSQESLAELATAAKWAEALLEDPITSFAGRQRSLFNNHMLDAEQALKAGEYYKAARFYERAHGIDSGSPLAFLGRGHALAAAGDYVTAAWSLQRGIERFPQIAAFRIDLPALVGQQDVFDIRRADLENELDRSEHYELRFLLGYLELYSELPADGLHNLRQAAELAPSGSIISIFPDLVLGHRPLPPVRRR